MPHQPKFSALFFDFSMYLYLISFVCNRKKKLRSFYESEILAEERFLLERFITFLEKKLFFGFRCKFKISMKFFKINKRLF